MRDRLTDALKRSTADYAEIRFEAEDWTSVAYRGPEVERAASAKTAGGVVRACTRGGWGVAVFDSLDDLDHQVAEACEAAAVVGREQTLLADVPPVDADCPGKLQRDFRGVPLDDKLALVRRYNDILLEADKAIETTTVSYSDGFRTVWFASTRGSYFREERPSVRLAFSATARDGTLVQRAHDGAASARTYDVAEGLEDRVLATAQRAVALLKAPPCQGGTYTVVLDPALGGVFAHEAFGHLSEADFLYENQKMRELMHLGRKMGVPQLSIVDDGSMPGCLGTHAFDDEGTPTGKTDLIRDGVLVGHLHSLETAAKMGERPTGNARALARGNCPIVRMTNTYIQPGKMTFQELLADVDRGIYACDMFGGQTMMEMFTFSSAYAYRIEHGRIGELIRDAVLTGNVFQTLHSIDAFGDDLRMLEKPGGCGKGGQSPLPVTFGSPHLRIRDVVVGGR